MEENNDLQTIDLQNKTTAKEGVIEIFEFEDEKTDLQKTVFHRMFIPLEPFNPGLTPESNTIDTKIVIDWLDLNLRSAINLDGLNLKTTPQDDALVYIRIDEVNNPCDIDTMKIKKIADNLYQVDCEIFIEFEHEKTAKNEYFTFSTQLQLDPNILSKKA